MLVLARINHGYDGARCMLMLRHAGSTARGREGPEGGCSVAVDGAQSGVTVC